jgi:hypothetical protein
VAPADGLRPPQLRIVTGSPRALQTDAARRPQGHDENLKGAAEGISRHPTMDGTSPHKHTQSSPFSPACQVTEVLAVSNQPSALSPQLRDRGVLADR